MTTASLAPENRDETGRFRSGASGNPGGRPKVAREFRQRAAAVVDAHVVAAWESEVIERGPHWVRCSELLAAYGYGKPTAIDDEGSEASCRPLEGLRPDQLIAIARGEPPDP